MKINFTSLNKDSIEPVKHEDGTISLFSIGAEQAVDATRRPVMIYHTGWSIEIPKGYNLLVFPPYMNVVTSLNFSRDPFASNFLFEKGNAEGAKSTKEFVAEFKIDTNVTPAVYGNGDEIARIYLVKKEQFELDITLAEAVAEITDEPTTDTYSDQSMVVTDDEIIMEDQFGVN